MSAMISLWPASFAYDRHHLPPVARVLPVATMNSLVVSEMMSKISSASGACGYFPLSASLTTASLMEMQSARPYSSVPVGSQQGLVV